MRTRLPTAVVALGLTSFFTDVGSEMIFPLLPVFVASLGAGPTFLGLVEGLADATASFLKLASGYVADRTDRKKPLVVLGYGLASAARPVMAIATAPWHVLFVRVVDRIGKGIRTSPRDVLLAAAAPEAESGRTFGFHRAMDHAGAVFGPLVATAMLARGVPLRTVFWAAAIPSAISVLVVSAVRESVVRRASPATPDDPRGPLPARLVTCLLIFGLFALGGSSDAFLLLRAKELGVSISALPALWTTLNVIKAASSYVGGSWSDRVPRTRLIAAGWAVYAFTYLGLAQSTEAWHAWALFIVYGTYYGLTEPSERALVRDIVAPLDRGRAFGWYNFVTGVTAVPAGLLTGWLWEHQGAGVALATGAAIAAVSALLLLGWASRSGVARAT